MRSEKFNVSLVSADRQLLANPIHNIDMNQNTCCDSSPISQITSRTTNMAEKSSFGDRIRDSIFISSRKDGKTWECKVGVALNAKDMNLQI